MIVTLTANPSVDRTVDLGGPLVRGEVQRAVRVRTDPGGKGVNVARAIVGAGELAVAVLPSRPDDPLVLALRDANVPYRAVPVDGPVRVNVTITEPDGVTTKINDPGLALNGRTLDAMLVELARETAGARWAALSGSLPPGVPADWYATVVRALRGPRGQRSRSTPPVIRLLALVAAGPESAPDLLKPNAEELADLTGDATSPRSSTTCSPRPRRRRTLRRPRRPGRARDARRQGSRARERRGRLVRHAAAHRRPQHRRRGRLLARRLPPRRPRRCRCRRPSAARRRVRRRGRIAARLDRTAGPKTRSSGRRTRRGARRRPLDHTAVRPPADPARPPKRTP